MGRGIHIVSHIFVGWNKCKRSPLPRFDLPLSCSPATLAARTSIAFVTLSVQLDFCGLLPLWNGLRLYSDSWMSNYGTRLISVPLWRFPKYLPRILSLDVLELISFEHAHLCMIHTHPTRFTWSSLAFQTVLSKIFHFIEIMMLWERLPERVRGAHVRAPCTYIWGTSIHSFRFLPRRGLIDSSVFHHANHTRYPSYLSPFPNLSSFLAPSRQVSLVLALGWEDEIVTDGNFVVCPNDVI